MRPLGKCLICGREVVNGPAAYPVRGWEVTRYRGGANRILGRQREPGLVAHVHCAQRAVELQRRGIHEAQEPLL